nr:hypothetical protein [Tanacetum cinerariifolium]
MIAFLAKPTESEGFEQIIDFLNANPIKYALTMNPKVNTSCIEIFWTTTKGKNINGEAQIHAKVDGKKVIISEASIRRDLRFRDQGGIDCFSNKVIFEQLTLMGYIFDNMVKNLDSMTKFMMYPRKNIFSNMRRVGKDFSRRVTPLFQTMLVQAQEEIGKGSVGPTDPHHTPTIIQPSTSQPSRKYKSKKTKRNNTELPQTSVPIKHVADEAVNKEMDDSLERATSTATRLDIEQDRGNISKTQSKVTPNEPTSLRTSLGGGPRRQDTIGDTVAQTRRVKRLEKKRRSRTNGLKRLYKVRLSPRVESFTDEESLDEDIFGVNDQDDTPMFDADKDLQGEDVVVEKEVTVEEVNAASITTPVSTAATTTTAATTPTISMDEITLAKH